MMKNFKVLKILFFLLAFSGSITVLKAQEFISTEPAERFFTFGVRAGVNTSNKTFPKNSFEKWNVNSWGAGITFGAVADVNFRQYLSLQPGFFFESRSGNFAYAADYITNFGTTNTQYQMGHSRSYALTIPIMGIGRFNISENMKWLVEFGPYLQFFLHQSDGDQIVILDRTPITTSYKESIASANTFDFGLKIGTGLEFLDHYYFGIHYMAGLLNAWKDPAGGKNKAWTFTLGYNF